RWPPRARRSRPTSPRGSTCSTPRARRGGPRASSRRCPSARSTRPATPCGPSSGRCWASTSTPSTTRPPRPTTRRRCASAGWWGPVLWEYYSSTEANGITLISPQEWFSHPGSVGQAKLGVVHICDADDGGRELPTGEIGTIYFERPQRPFEYHHDPEKTREA